MTLLLRSIFKERKLMKTPDLPGVWEIGQNTHLTRMIKYQVSRDIQWIMLLTEKLSVCWSQTGYPEFNSKTHFEQHTTVLFLLCYKSLNSLKGCPDCIKKETHLLIPTHMGLDIKWGFPPKPTWQLYWFEFSCLR